MTSESKRARQAAWRCEDCIEQLSAVFRKHAGRLLSENINLYVHEFSARLVGAKLAESQELLFDLVSLDQRGGIFRQRDVATAMKCTLAASERFMELDNVASRILADNKDQVCEIIAYTVRVMLYHLRNKFQWWDRGGRVGVDPSFQTHFGLIVKHLESPAGQVVKRQVVAKPKENPFVYFRDDPVAETVEPEEEETFVIARIFDPIAFLAKKIHSDGEVMLADIYERGPRGMVIARWLDDQSELELEIVNDLAVEGAIEAYVGEKQEVPAVPAHAKEEKVKKEKEKKAKKVKTAKKVIGKKKKLKQAKKALGAEAFVPVSVKQEAEPEAPPQKKKAKPTELTLRGLLNLRPSHGLAHAICWGDGTTGRTQLIQVKHVHAAEQTPRMVAAEIANVIVREFSDEFSTDMCSTDTIPTAKVFSQTDLCERMRRRCQELRATF